MTEARADEIVRKVFYSYFPMFPDHNHYDEDRDFHLGRMLGMMQATLEQELSKEVVHDE